MINIVIRVILLLITCILISLVFIRLPDVIILINLFVLLVLQVVLLIRYLNKTNDKLANFFMAIENDDTSLNYTRRKPEKAFRKLYESMDQLNEKVRNVRLDNYRQHQFFKAVTEQVKTGLLGFDSDGKIELYNRAAQSLLGINRLLTINALDQKHKHLSSTLQSLKPNQTRLVKITNGNSIHQLSLHASEYKIFEKSLKLVSIQDIKNELEDRELESWQKLIRVLTHEIMNSIGPISSTIKTIKEFLSTDGKDHIKPVSQLEQEIIGDTYKGLGIIEERSDGLVDFVERFRSLTLLSKPECTSFLAEELFTGITHLLDRETKKANVTISQEIIPSSLRIYADKNLIGQVLINLIKNAMQALNDSPDKKITLKAFSFNEDSTFIQVIDNGPGISVENLEKIFIPFFTTKSEGSGIGLSISRQIMRQHNGTLHVQSKPGETVFTLKF